MEENIIMKNPDNREALPNIGVYVCHCGLNIAQTVDCQKVTETAAEYDGVVVSKDISYACSEPGQQQIKDDILEHGLDRIVIASCSPRLHEPTFRQMLKETGLNPYVLEMANLREQCSWVHMNEPIAATEKAINLDVDVETVKQVYMAGWESGCKGVTVYRDGCRTGVLIKSGNYLAKKMLVKYLMP